MKANKRKIKANLEETVEPTNGEINTKELDRMMLKSTKKLGDLIADFMVKSEKKMKRKK